MDHSKFAQTNNAQNSAMLGQSKGPSVRDTVSQLETSLGDLAGLSHEILNRVVGPGPVAIPECVEPGGPLKGHVVSLLDMAASIRGTLQEVLTHL